MNFLRVAKEYVRGSRYRLPIIVGASGALICGGFKFSELAEFIKTGDDAAFRTENILLAEQCGRWRDLTGTQLLAKAFGFGDDWMAQLPLETRLMFWKWPWSDWIVYNVNPMPWCNYQVFDDIDIATHSMKYTTEMCPDCYRVVLWTLLLVMLAKKSIHYVGKGNMVITLGLLYMCSVGLITGESSGMQIIGNSSEGNIALNDHRDLAYSAWIVHFRRNKYKVDKFMVETTGMEQAILQQAHKVEFDLKRRLIPINEIDDYVRTLSEEKKQEIGIIGYEFGLPHPEEEFLTFLRQQGKHPDLISSPPLPYSNKDTADLNEMELFMLKLQSQLDDDNKPKSAQK